MFDEGDLYSEIGLSLEEAIVDKVMRITAIELEEKPCCFSFTISL